MQACPSNYFGHATDHATSLTTSGVHLAKFRIDEDVCMAQCNCEANFRGSVSCSLNATEIAALRALRSLVVIDNVYYQITREYPTEPVAISWISSIAAASQKLSKLDNSIAAQVLSSNKFVISESSNLQLSHDVLSVVLPSVNSVASAPVKVNLYSSFE